MAKLNSEVPTLKLNDGAAIPMVGYGLASEFQTYSALFKGKVFHGDYGC